MLRELSEKGTRTARQLYGAKRGWVFHQNTDLWRPTTPMDGPNWGGFTLGGAWLSTHIWEHYLYTRDMAFLEENYSVMKGAAEFFLDFLDAHPDDGSLMTCPSTSPENTPKHDNNKPFFDEANGTTYSGSQLTYGSAIDRQILMDLFAYVAKASELLGQDEALRQELLEKRRQLAPMKVGKDGSLQEWYDDWEGELGHRHFSHLYGLHPGRVISPVKTPELIDACKAVLNTRGDGSTGWSRAWKICQWARLQEGERARRIFLGYLKDQSTESLFGLCGGSMQVDSTFGVTEGITEMLLQSHEGYLDLLPALPKAWGKGRFSGVVARGAFEMDFQFDQGIVTDTEVKSKAGGTCRFSSAWPPAVTSASKPVAVQQLVPGRWSFETKAGRSYRIDRN